MNFGFLETTQKLAATDAPNFISVEGPEAARRAFVVSADVVVHLSRNGDASTNDARIPANMPVSVSAFSGDRLSFVKGDAADDGTCGSHSRTARFFRILDGDRRIGEPLAVTNLERALGALGIDPRYAADGFRAANPFVVAVLLGERGIRGMPSNKHKIPKIKNWQNDASADPVQLVRWQARFQSPCWSVLTGRHPNGGGIWILDEDDLAGGARREELERELGPLPQTWSVVSGREGGGRHYWFAPAPDGPDLKTVAHAMIAGQRGRIDQRGRGGHAVIPGSRHKSGRRYAWAPGCAPDECELASLPPSWLAALDMADTPTMRSERRGSSGPRARIEHDGSNRVFGDGPGRGGFNGPIYYWACWFFGEYGTDADADADHLIAWLQRKIESAPRDPGRSDSEVSRYLSETYLREQAVRARDYIKQEDSYGFECDG